MSHQSGHVIIRGGNYAPNSEPEPGETSLEVHYTPSAGLTPDQVSQNVKKLLKLADKIYHVEEQPDE